MKEAGRQGGVFREGTEPCPWEKQEDMLNLRRALTARPRGLVSTCF